MGVALEYLKSIKVELTKISWTKKDELISTFFLILIFLVISALLFSLLDVFITFLISKVLYV